jgi:hypothetical protein
VAWHGQLDRLPPSEEAVAAFLRSLVDPQRTVFSTVTVLRAAQTTLSPLGVGVKIDLRAFLMAREDTPVGLDTDAVAKLHMYANPRYSAIAALQRIADLPPATVIALPVSAVDRRQHRLVYGDVDVSFPPLSRPSMYALLAERLILGAHPSDPLFDSTYGKELGLVGHRRTLTTVSAETGLRLTGSWKERTAGANVRWNQRRGITIFRTDCQ